MASFGIFILLIFSLNMWLAFTTLVAVISGVIRVNGKAFSREKEPYEFWLTVTSKTFAAIVFFYYLVSVTANVLHFNPLSL